MGMAGSRSDHFRAADREDGGVWLQVSRTIDAP